MEELPGHHLHHLLHLNLSNGYRLVLKVTPPPETVLLRHERRLLQSEFAAISALARTDLPIPKILKYESRNAHLGAPFLLTSRLEGVKYADILPYMTRTERAGIERQIQILSSTISQHSNATFGHAGLVSSKAGGFTSWREAFLSMVDAVIMDGEDMMVNLPYFQIREAISRWENYLDEVNEARLFILDLGRPENVLLNQRTKEVTGLLDFGLAIWGDPDMACADGKTDIKSLL